MFTVIFIDLNVFLIENNVFSLLIFKGQYKNEDDVREAVMSTTEVK